jgi:hypothetical protein
MASLLTGAASLATGGARTPSAPAAASVPSRDSAQEVQPPSRQQQHDALARAVSAQGAVQSRFSNGVSLHTMKQSVSFANLRSVVTAASGHETRTFVGTIDGSIVVSVNFNYTAPVGQTSQGGPAKRVGKKRGRDADEEAVDHAVNRVMKGLSEDTTIPPEAVASARKALYSLLTSLRGARGECAVESWGLTYKRPEAASLLGGTRPRLILSARLTPGVAVPLKSLFQALGPRCAADGMLTTQPSTSLANGFDLPLSDQAKAAELHGQKALTLFATVTES